MLAMLCVAVACAGPALASATSKNGLHPPPAITANGLPDASFGMSGMTRADQIGVFEGMKKPVSDKLLAIGIASPPKLGVPAKPDLAATSLEMIGAKPVKIAPTASPPARTAGAYSVINSATIGARGHFYTGDQMSGMNHGPGGAHARAFDRGFHYRS